MGLIRPIVRADIEHLKVFGSFDARLRLALNIAGAGPRAGVVVIIERPAYEELGRLLMQGIFDGEHQFR